MADTTAPHIQHPIAAALLQFRPADAEGPPNHRLSPDHWHRMLRPVVQSGYSAVEIPSAWLRLGDLDERGLADFRATIDDLGLSVPGISVVRESVIHPHNAARNIAFSHRTIDAAAALGVDIVCLGLLDRLTSEQQRALWFWTVPGTPYPSDPHVRRAAVAAYRELAEHAASVGVRLSLELYEDTFLGTGDDAVAFLGEIDHDAVGLNPDIGNLIRRQGPIEDWRDLLRLTLPHTNYWHVKNYMRLEDPASGTVLTHPTAIELGIIDYREALQMAAANGFNGAFVVEHYGGDGLSVGARNADYLRSVLAQTAPQDGDAA